MNWKTWVPLVLAIGLGLAAMKVARDMILKNQTPQVVESGKQIVVLTKDLPAGALVAADDLGTARMSGDLNTEAIFTQPSDVEGRVLTVAAIKGAPIVQAMLAPKGTGSGLQALIPDGMRAITIQIDEFSGVAGNLAPGARVDVLATIAGENGEMVSRTVVQNIKVQSLGMRRPPDANGNSDANAGLRSVTLLATPKEAEMIELAVQSRHLLVLRGSNDNDTTSSEGVTVTELRGGQSRDKDPFAFDPQPARQARADSQAPVSPPVATTQPMLQVARPARRERQIEVIRGGVESVTKVPEVASPVGPRLMTGASTDELPGEQSN